MNGYKRLFNDTVIIGIGNLGSKMISFLLIPLYTFYLSTSEFGIVDLISVSSSLLLPLVSMSVYQGVLRYGMEKSINKSEVFTIGLLVTILGNSVFFLFYIIISKIIGFNELINYVLIIMFFQSLQELLAHFSKSLGKIKIFAVNGILMAIITGVLSIIFVGYLELNVLGYVSALVIGNVFSILFFSVALNLSLYIKFKAIKLKNMIEIFKYSVPLIPNSLSLRLTSSASRFFIIYYLSASSSGIFALANKIPQLLAILYTIFFQAWQLTAIEKFKSERKSEIYTRVFSTFSMLMFIFSAFILMILKPLISFIAAPEFYDSWKYVPFILLGTVFSSFSGFLGTNYIAAKNTKGVLKTSFLGMIISVLLNLLLIPILGLYGAGISLTVSYGIIWIIRYFDTKKIIGIKLNTTNIVVNTILYLLQTFTLFAINNNVILAAIQMLIFIFILITNKDLFKLITVFKSTNKKGVYNEKNY